MSDLTGTIADGEYYAIKTQNCVRLVFTGVHSGTWPSNCTSPYFGVPFSDTALLDAIWKAYETGSELFVSGSGTNLSGTSYQGIDSIRVVPPA